MLYNTTSYTVVLSTELKYTGVMSKGFKGSENKVFCSLYFFDEIPGTMSWMCSVA